MTAHFTLDVDPEGLRSVARKLDTLEEHLTTKGKQVSGTPADIGDEWTGEAATSVKGEMTGLGGHMTDFAGKFHSSAAALRSLAKDYEDAVAGLESLNKKWEQSETDYSTAVAKADTAHQTQLDKAKAANDGKPVNRAERDDYDTARTTAKGDAADERQTTQHNLEYSFGMTKIWLAQQTRACGDKLASYGPIPITQEQIDSWKGGKYPTDLRRDDLLSGLTLSAEKRRLELEEAARIRREEAREDAKEDIENLNEALDDGDPEAIAEALEKIGDRSNDPVYAEELVNELGPGGVEELYGKVDDGIADHELYMEELWPSLEKFNDTVANGLAQLDAQELTDFLDEFMDGDTGPAAWALISSSDYANGKMTAAAMVYSSEIYNNGSTDGMRSGLFPQVFNYAYGDDSMLEVWDENSSGADLADLMEKADEDQRKEFMERLLNISTDGGTMNEDEWQHLADLYGETLVELKDRHLAALEDSDGATPDLLLWMLEYRWFPHDQTYSEPFAPYLAELVSDPEWALWYLNASRSGYEPAEASLFKDLLDESGVKPEEVIGSIMALQLARGDNPEQVASNLGLLLRQNDLLGDDIKWGGVLKSITTSAISGVLKNPLTGPVLGVFDALFAEINRLEQADKNLDDAMGKNAIQNIYAFTIYTQAHDGEPPPGFDAYVAENGLEDNPRAINLFITHLEQTGGPGWEEIQNYATLIDESRDEE